MIRWFLHMVNICSKPGPLSHSHRLRLINPSALFYPKDKEDALPLDQAAAAIGRSILYDPATHIVRALPAMTTPMFCTLSLTVGNDLYITEIRKDT
ncbi:hypothetical protein E2562_034974 [Oryza meyeriana var. granulata]|uniref:Uncharacterized protein n=1 Tax=Oryza meyeriana var. granulata TaxID=110450 RepID=A0A6G1FFB3_9ORYZ|nr:hypothetical protein E2562_034974 [Oryza meyeriana var. granulata]